MVSGPGTTMSRAVDTDTDQILFSRGSLAEKDPSAVGAGAVTADGGRQHHSRAEQHHGKGQQQGRRASYPSRL